MYAVHLSRGPHGNADRRQLAVPHAPEQGPGAARRRRPGRRRRGRRPQHAPAGPGPGRGPDGAVQARVQQGRAAGRHGRPPRGRDRPAARRDRLEDGHPRAGAVGPPGVAAPPLGVPGRRDADPADPGGDGLHGLDDRALPGRGVVDRPDPSRDARHGQPPPRVQPGTVRRQRRRRSGHGRRDAPVDGRRLPQHHRAGPGDHPRPGVGTGCDDQFEFEFALDLLLDGLERIRGRG